VHQQQALATIESMDNARAEEALDSLEASLTMQRASLAAEGLVTAAPQNGTGAGSGTGTGVPAMADGDIEGVLRELRKQPSDDAECTAKFGVFEGYLSTVEKVRTDTFKFWEDAKTEFAPGARAAVETELKRLDNRDNMGLSDEAFGEAATVWFVQPMARQASRNNLALTATLASLRTRLELLNRDCDCPICLEPLSTISSEVMTLPCCHRVCQPCWVGWTQARGVNNVFCPLCRHHDFLEFVFAAAPQSVGVMPASGGTPAAAAAQ